MADKPEEKPKTAETAEKTGENVAKEGEKDANNGEKSATHSTDSTEATSALNILGIKRQPNSKCFETDQRCIKRENEEAARKAMELAEKMKGVFVKEKKEHPRDPASGLECTMDGFVAMSKEVTEVLFMLLALVKETAVSMIPPEFSKAVKHGWDGMVGI